MDAFEHVFLADGELDFCPEFFDRAESDRVFEELKRTTAWKEEKIRLFGRFVAMPRLTAWYGDPGASYKYSGLLVEPRPWTPILLKLKHAVEEASGARFNSVLLNFYRDGRDSVSWHADDERELGPQPVIASLSFGETRRFQMKHKDKGARYDVDLPHGSYLLMKGATQRFWRHQVPKELDRKGARINLTFRMIVQN